MAFTPSRCLLLDMGMYDPETRPPLCSNPGSPSLTVAAWCYHPLTHTLQGNEIVQGGGTVENGGEGYSLLCVFAVELAFKNSSVHVCYIKQGVSERLHSVPVQNVLYHVHLLPSPAPICLPP